MPCPAHHYWPHTREDCPMCAAEDAFDVRASARRLELSQTYAEADLDTILCDITLLTQIAMFKAYTQRQRLERERKT